MSLPFFKISVLLMLDRALLITVLVALARLTIYIYFVIIIIIIIGIIMSSIMTSLARCFRKDPIQYGAYSARMRYRLVKAKM